MKKKDIEREYRKFVENWLPKFVERLQLSLLCIKDKREIREEDWEAIRTAFRNYYFGYLPDFIPPWQPPQKESKQTTIFGTMEEMTAKKEVLDNLAEEKPKEDLGADFGVTLFEPTIIIENDTDKKVQKSDERV